MKNILVATDLSTRSDRAVQRAVRLSAKLGLPCHVLSVIDDDLPADMRATLLKDVEARLAQFVKSVAAPGQTVTSAAVAGDPQEVLLGLAEPRRPKKVATNRLERRLLEIEKLDPKAKRQITQLLDSFIEGEKLKQHVAAPQRSTARTGQRTSPQEA